MGQLQLLRAGRAIVLTLLTVTVAVGAHHLGHGHSAPVWLMLAAAVAGWPFLYAVSARRWTYTQVFAFMGLTQLLMHAVMQMSMPLSHHAHVTVHDSGLDVRMVVAHLGATALLAGAVALGERALDWTITLVRLIASFEPTPVQLWHRAEHACLTRLQSLLRAENLAGRAPPRGTRHPLLSIS